MLRKSRVILLFFTAVMLTACSSKNKELAAGSNILIHFDRADYDRMNQFVERFHEGKGDLLMAIPATIEGGPIIYDLQSDGRQIKVTRDDTRDAYSSSPGKTTVVCRAIEWEETGDSKRIAMSKCDGADGERLSLFDFEKQRL